MFHLADPHTKQFKSIDGDSLPLKPQFFTQLPRMNEPYYGVLATLYLLFKNFWKILDKFGPLNSTRLKSLQHTI